MTPITEAIAELRLAVAYIERRELAPGSTYSDYTDLRTEALAELMDALDRIDPGLGRRLQLVLYPRVDPGLGRRLQLVLYPRVDALIGGGQLGAKPGHVPERRRT